MKFFDSFLKRYGAFIVSFVLAFLFVLLARPFPVEKFHELSFWWYVLPVVLIVALTYFFYRRLRRKEPGDREENLETGE